MKTTMAASERDMDAMRIVEVTMSRVGDGEHGRMCSWSEVRQWRPDQDRQAREATIPEDWRYSSDDVCCVGS
jgi:hypothetical protein